MHVFLAVKSGTCPVVPFRCKMYNPPNHCESDGQCTGEEKCCDTGCGLNCVLTPKEKPGTCPLVTVRCLVMNPPNRCDHDQQCLGPRKCCETSCGRHCILLHRDQSKGHIRRCT
uniref:WAP domain-containing protein n=1 Tax=Chelydra serpentina TaxID=8475 RepID=A0A8C3SN86_CHESE